MKYSFVIPVYNRPEEIKELLDSLTKLEGTVKFEIIVIEDGSSIRCENVVNKFSQLDVKYFYKANSGPGDSRNYGMSKASGNYFIILDSDCIVPPGYLNCVDKFLRESYFDAYGGPDAAHDSFTILQKSINYSMTSLLTTGGIRGKGEGLDKFYPRSFNMGISKKVFEVTKGFSKMRFGEDIDMSKRIMANGFKTVLIKEAFVYHKRRNTLKSFFKQIYNSGIARINLWIKYPDTMKAVHFFPFIFVLFFTCSIIMTIFSSHYFIVPLLFYFLILFVDSTLRNKNILIGAFSMVTTTVQFFAYGLGFMDAFVKRMVFRKGSFKAFTRSFYD